MRLSEYTVTEAGPSAPIWARRIHEHQVPHVGNQAQRVVIVATVRALKLHGGVPLKELAKPNVECARQGRRKPGKNTSKHPPFRTAVVVAINHFSNDTPEEIQFI